MESVLNEVVRLARRETEASRHDVNARAKSISEDVRDLAARCVRDVEDAIRAGMADFGRRDLAGLDDQRLIAARSDLEAPISEALENAKRTLDSVRSQLEAIDLRSDSSLLDQLAAVEQSNVTLQEQTAADLQLAQLGMAIEIISHEFGAAIRSVRSGLRGLKAWADANRELMSLYQRIRGSFDHLDAYLTLFTPLQRRLYRKTVDIRGWEIPRVPDQPLRSATGQAQHRTGPIRLLQERRSAGLSLFLLSRVHKSRGQCDLLALGPKRAPRAPNPARRVREDLPRLRHRTRDPRPGTGTTSSTSGSLGSRRDAGWVAHRARNAA